MAKKFTDLLRRAYRARDADELEAIEKEAGDPDKEEKTEEKDENGDHHTHVHIYPPGEGQQEAKEEKKEEKEEMPPPEPNGDPDKMNGNGNNHKFTDIEELGEAVSAMQDQHEQMLADLEAIKDALDLSDDDMGRLRDRRRDARRDDRRRDARRRDTDASRRRDARRDARDDDDDDADRARDEEPNASESGANKGTEELLGQLEFEAPPGTGDRARKARDSAMPLFRDLWRDTEAACEVLAPGMRLPTFDSAARPEKTYDCICDMRRRSLDIAIRDPLIADAVQSIFGRQPLDLPKMSVRDLSILFGTVVSHKRMLNNTSRGGWAGGGDGSGSRQPMSKLRSNADINRANAEFWARQQGGAAH